MPLPCPILHVVGRNVDHRGPNQLVLLEHYGLVPSAPRLAGFRFDLLDVQNPMFHPEGAGSPETARLPYEPHPLVLACAVAVFIAR